MIRLILAALVTGISFGVAVASFTGKLTIEGMSMSLVSIFLIVLLSVVVYFLNRKHKENVNYS